MKILKILAKEKFPRYHLQSHGPWCVKGEKNYPKDFSVFQSPYVILFLKSKGPVLRLMKITSSCLIPLLIPAVKCKVGFLLKVHCQNEQIIAVKHIKTHVYKARH